MNSLVTIVFVVAALWFGYQVGERGSYKKGWSDGYDDGVEGNYEDAEKLGKAIRNDDLSWSWK
mgnify:CR=1 FL=1|tara:strand:+ start:28 stop:216 length:189 start_codon:yes stop_codon:yes gene_type:complete